MFVGGEDLLDVPGKNTSQWRTTLSIRYRSLEGTHVWSAMVYMGNGEEALVWGGLLGVLMVKSGVVCGLRASWSL